MIPVVPKLHINPRVLDRRRLYFSKLSFCLNNLQQLMCLEGSELSYECVSTESGRLPAIFSHLTVTQTPANYSSSFCVCSPSCWWSATELFSSSLVFFFSLSPRLWPKIAESWMFLASQWRAKHHWFLQPREQICVYWLDGKKPFTMKTKILADKPDCDSSSESKCSVWVQQLGKSSFKPHPLPLED